MKRTMEQPVIVLAEDEVLTRLCVAAALQADYRVLQAGNGEEANRLIDQYAEYIHAVITDVTMPDVDGWAVLAHITARKLSCHAIVMSAHHLPDDTRWQQYPQAVFCPKPVDIHMLKALLLAPHEHRTRRPKPGTP